MSSLEQYEKVIEEIQVLFEHKNHLYGNSAFTNNPGVPSFQLWMRLSDVRRKSARLEDLTYHASQGSREALKKLISDYKDLANYAIIAVAVLENLGEAE